MRRLNSPKAKWRDCREAAFRRDTRRESSWWGVGRDCCSERQAGLCALGFNYRICRFYDLDEAARRTHRAANLLLQWRHRNEGFGIGLTYGEQV
jgi:hypothetical protein